MYSIKLKRYCLLKDNKFVNSLRIFHYKKYKINLGLLKKNLLFLNLKLIINFFFYGLNLKTLKLSKNLNNLGLKLILSISLIKILKYNSLKLLSKFFPKNLKKQFLNNFFKLLKKNLKTNKIFSLNYFYSKRWF